MRQALFLPLVKTYAVQTFARGLDLARNQAVESIEFEPVDTQQWRLSAQVIGSRGTPYLTAIDLWLDDDRSSVRRWTSHCTCPMQGDCKHTAALLLSVDDDLLSPIDPAMRQSRWNEQVQVAERWWLSSAGPVQAVAPAGRASASKQASESPIYCLFVRSEDGPGSPLRLSLAAAYVKANGAWSKPRAVSLNYFATAHKEYRTRPVSYTDTDQEAIDLMAALPMASQPYTYYNVSADRWLNGVAAPLVLERAMATGRLIWRTEHGEMTQALRAGPPLALEWAWRKQEGLSDPEPLWQLQGHLPSSHAQALLCHNPPHLWYVDLAKGHLGKIEGGAAVGRLLQAPPLPEPLMLKHQPAVRERLANVVPMPPPLAELRSCAGPPVWRLFLSRIAPQDSEGYFSAAYLSAQLDFDYQGLQGWWPPEAPACEVFEHQGERVLLQRDVASEALADQRLRELGLAPWLPEGMYAMSPQQPPSLWLDWAMEAYAPLREAGFVLTMEAGLHEWVREGGEVQVRLQPRDGADPAEHLTDSEGPSWFDLSLGLDIDGERIDVLPWIPRLVQSLRETSRSGALALPARIHLPAPDGRRFVRVQTAALQPWMDALLELFDDRQTRWDAGSLQLSRMDALRARMSLGEGAVWEAVPMLAQMARRLQGQAELPHTPLPAGLQAELRPYQHQGLDWLQFLRAHGLAGILADDMGLGKTLQTLAHLCTEKASGRLDRPALVVAPVSLMGNWQREAARFCPGLQTLVWHGTERHDRVDAMPQADLVIVPYSLLQRDRQRWIEQPWHLVVLDEAQHIKNAHTQAAQVVAELHTRHRLCLSGTPIENHLGELWSLFHFLMPGFLGSLTRFQQHFRHPIEKQGDTTRLAQLRARLTPFILRRTKQQVAHELPPKIESVVTVELEPKQANLYETIRLSMEKTVREAIATKGLAKSQIVFLDALLKLRQVCCDPRLVKTEAAAKVKSSAKMTHLMSVLPEMIAEGRRVLLFSQFTSMLTLIEAELARAGIPWVKLTGQTRHRDEVIDRFTRGEVPLFLISLKAGGVGLNLPQADTVIHFDPWWNPAAENQATDRAHRIGQTQSVWVLKLVAQGTIEERILALQARKAELAQEIYSGSVGRKQPTFTEDDVRELLKPMA
jgi:superfamily II DNA or RNA helicase